LTPNGWQLRLDENDTTHPSLFGTLQETMGLRLQPAKGPVGLFVNDRIT
jgi:uncharacterized protein (TIGR03435 family)